MLSAVPYYPLQRLNARFEPALSTAVAEVVGSGWYLHGRRTQEFEQHFAEYSGVRHAVACANGLDALTLVLMAWKRRFAWQTDDEVVVPAFTFAATGLAVVRAGLRPVWAEVGDDALLSTHALHRFLTPRTRVVVPVHLYGRLCDMARLKALQQKHKFLILEDAAQAHGARRDNYTAGHLGEAAALSFYPTKNLGALGDAGMVMTNDEALARDVRMLANYGAPAKYQHEAAGLNSRMDEIQAAVLDVKLPHLTADNARRAEIAAHYRSEIRNTHIHLLPEEAPSSHPVNHIFPVFCRQPEALRAYLAGCHIETLRHYPLPLHKQTAFDPYPTTPLPTSELLAQTQLSLPMHPLLTEEEVGYICKCINEYSINDLP